MTVFRITCLADEPIDPAEVKANEVSYRRGYSHGYARALEDIAQHGKWNVPARFWNFCDRALYRYWRHKVSRATYAQAPSFWEWTVKGEPSHD